MSFWFIFQDVVKVFLVKILHIFVQNEHKKPLMASDLQEQSKQFKVLDWSWNESFSRLIVVRCAIQYHVHNLKNVKNTHGGVLLLVSLQLY